MAQVFEIVKLSKDAPARITCYSGDGIARRWFDRMELIFVLQGHINIIDEERNSYLSPENVFVINAGTFCEVKAEGEAAFLSLAIKLEKLDPKLKGARFDCDSSQNRNKEIYWGVKHMFALLVKANGSDGEANIYRTKALLFSIIYELCDKFPKSAMGTVHTDKHLSRLNNILLYIDQHFSEALTLSQVAEMEHLSVPYLSAFFEKYVGVNFTVYYNDLRLRRAVNALLSSDASVENIALQNGFTDPRSFVNLFKKKYGIIPSVYRKQSSDDKTAADERSGYLRSDSESALKLLAKYLSSQPDREKNEKASGDAGQKSISVDEIDVSVAGTPLKHKYKTITTVGRAKELLYEDIREMLREWQKNMNFEYIKFHGLLSDDMHVYREDDKGNPIYSFVLIDKVFDFLLSIGLKPFVQLSFMPQALALIKDRQVFSSPFNVSPPKDIKKWINLIDAFMNHIIERYSFRTVRSWLFCVWNEPDTGDTLFGFSDTQKFLEFYKATYNKVKSFGKTLRFGSPSMLISCMQNKDWVLSFIGYCKKEDCIPDFLNFHYYDNDFSWDELSEHKPAKPSYARLNKDENSFHKTVAQIKLLVQDANLDCPVYITEWNLTVSHRNLLNDTCFKSCYLCKNLLENYDELDSFAYWSLTDFIEELQPSPQIFQGGLGLLTYNGIKKPHYFAFSFLSKLGDNLIARGDGYFITKRRSSIQIIMYNYEHFNYLFASGEQYDMTYTKRYTPFTELGRMDISLGLINLPGQKCTVREHIINAKHGSPFDQWLRMGAAALCDEDINYLKSTSVPRLQISEMDIADGALTISAMLEPLEVRLIEISL